MRTFSGLRAWLMIALALAIVFAVLGAIAVVTIGILLFLLPVLILMAVLSYVFMWFRRGRRPRGTSQLPVILEGEYRVVDPEESPQVTNGDESQPR